MAGFHIPNGDEDDRMNIPGWPERFRNGDGVTFERPVGEADAAWWHENFVETCKLYPAELANLLSEPAPGNKKVLVYEWISALQESFSLKREGYDGNTRIWFHASEIAVRGRLFGDASFYQDRLDIEREYRGRLYAQQVMRPIADLAARLGIGRIALDAQDIGGYLWAEAGALPKGSMTTIEQEVRNRADRLRRRGEITIELQDQIGDMLAAGHAEPRMVWALSRLPQEVKSSHARNPMDPEKIALGKELLIGVSWKAEIDLGNRFSRLAFKRWLRRRS